MSLRVGLGASEADLDVQGEIDFDFFEASESSNYVNNTVSANHENSITLNSTDDKIGSDICPLLDCENEMRKQEFNENTANILESSCSNYMNKPVITVSCDDATGFIQKTNIETVIPTPYNYKDNKCGKGSPVGFKKTKRVLSPLLKSKVFNDENEISDDSSLSSMSESDSDLSSVSEDSFELNNESDSMTDVTPLNSPFKCSSPMPNNLKLVRETSSEVKKLRKEGVKFPDDMDKNECPKCDAIDIDELLKAVKRLETGQNINSVYRGKSASSSVSIITQNAKCRKNLSFSNEEVRRIDNNNLILLRKINAQQNRQKPKASSVRTVSASSVNRQKQQRQIELENVALLKRLESTKASRDVSRFHLLRDYERRSAGVLSRPTSRSGKSTSQGTSSHTSSTTSGRSSAISLKSNSSFAPSVPNVNKS